MMIMTKTSSTWKKTRIKWWQWRSKTQESNDDHDKKHLQTEKKQESNDDNDDQTYDIITTQNDGKTVSLPCIAFEVCGQH